jgi:hypothetical protein
MPAKLKKTDFYEDQEKWNQANSERTRISKSLNWEEHIRPYTEAEQSFLDAHPLKGLPDPECGECAGSGIRQTEYSPKSKWDWWQIGGRWTGALVPDYDPATQDANLEWCSLCGGTGQRDDELGRQEREKHPGYSCNGCNGKGIRTKWPTSWARFEGDVMPVSEIPPGTSPFVFVTPEGEWIEKGEMGWFGMASNEKDEGDWAEQSKAILEQYSDCIAVVVDCHI